MLKWSIGLFQDVCRTLSGVCNSNVEMRSCNCTSEIFTSHSTDTSCETSANFPHTEVPTHDNTARLRCAFIQHTHMSRLPLPEPTVFSGDSLKYNSWETSFDQLIDRKPISSLEKLHYMVRYLKGPAHNKLY